MRRFILVALLLLPSINVAHGQRLSLTADPIMTADVVSSTLYYDGASMSGGSKWTAGSKRDVFWTGSTLCTGSNWAATDIASRNLVWSGSDLINVASFTCDTSQSTDVTCAANACTLKGSIAPSATGQLRADFMPGQNRRYEFWNMHNGRPVTLKVNVTPPDPPGYIVYDMSQCSRVFPNTSGGRCQYPNFLPFNEDVNNRGFVFTGLPTEVSVVYDQGGFLNTQDYAAGVYAVIGWNGVQSGIWGNESHDNGGIARTVKLKAVYTHDDAVGINEVMMLMGTANWPSPNPAKATVLYGGTVPAIWGNLIMHNLMTIKYRGG